MTYMFVYPLIGGVIFYALIRLLLPRVGRYKGYRLFYNVYNSGIAALTVGSLFKGILEIAGADSIFTKYFFAAGWFFVSAGVVSLIITALIKRRI
jgi:hypothetical protein